MNYKLRKAKKEDAPEVLSLIRELALYEKAPEEATITLEDLLTDGFSNHPAFEIILFEIPENGIVAMAFYFKSYSTWKGKCIYLEDIVVKEKHRGKGYGKILFDAMVLIAKQEGARRLQWQVLDWNEPAINFYKKYDAVLDPTWINCKLTADQIQNFNSKLINIDSIK